ncbi:MAG TPA: phosphoheptose isomerase, partial [Thermoplasmata archaeon]|nr:phosphoheptose isomerase [Thermoplasmata archaeon]
MKRPSPDDGFVGAVDRRLRDWEREDLPRRIWSKDSSLWPSASSEEVIDRMGWLGLPESMTERIDEIEEFADEVRDDGLRRVVLLGMGGSSVAAAVLSRVFPRSRGALELRPLDTTHPDAVRIAVRDADLTKVLFVVSSKSGTTIEPHALLEYFWDRCERARAPAGRQFVAISDAGTPLAQIAEARGFRRCFVAPGDVGGRFGALTEFGLVPAALTGAPIRKVLESAEKMAGSCRPSVPALENPALRLGAELGESAASGRDKLLFFTTPAISAFPPWAEQLVAESTGKDGRGLIPVLGGMLPSGGTRAPDATAVAISTSKEEDAAWTGGLDRIESDGTPVIRFRVRRREDIGGEFFRWEFGIVVAAIALGVDPFNQPDVESAKAYAREALRPEGARTADAAPAPTDAVSAEGLREAGAAWKALARPRDYLAIQAFLNPSAGVTAALARLGSVLASSTGLPCTWGFGPAFLHSTGQLHKGGPPTGLFLQLIDHPSADVAVPGAAYSMGELRLAQA